MSSLISYHSTIMPVPIANTKKYLERMQGSLKDKLYFTSVIEDPGIFFDFGCADGSLIFTLAEMYPEATFYGYDHDSDMIQNAMGMEIPNAYFSTDLDWLLERCWIEQDEETRKVVLVLNSVVHECYSYLNAPELLLFWDLVLRAGWDYIAFRDMAISNACFRDVRPEWDNDRRKLVEKANPQQIIDFTKHHGSLYNNANFVHFLLKYRYTDNWEREVRENYLLSLEDILDNFNISTYKTIFMHHYQIPWIANKIQEDFDIKLNNNTHLKLVLKRK